MSAISNEKNGVAPFLILAIDTGKMMLENIKMSYSFCIEILSRS